MKLCVDARQSFNHVTVPTESKLPLIQIGIEKQQNISDLKIGSIDSILCYAKWCGDKVSDSKWLG